MTNDLLELTAVNSRIDEVLSDCPSVMRPMMGHLKNAKGKGIRAVLIIQAAKGVARKSGPQSTILPDETIDFAASVELLHLATLVHDDIIDNSILRRGVASLQYEFGKKSAVLTGDFIFTKCYKLVSKSNKDRLEDFASTAGLICVGEMLQHEFNKNYDITEKQYFKVIAGKTAALFAFSLYGSAVIVKADEVTANRLFRAGYYMGMVFQIIDDCLDYDGDEKTVKKSLCKDLEEGFVTYPLISAMKQNPELKEYIKSCNVKKLKVSEKKKIFSEVRKCGAIDKSRDAAKRFYNLSKKYINLALPEQLGEDLLNTLDLVFYRKS